jgi:hypothetical protein
MDILKWLSNRPALSLTYLNNFVLYSFINIIFFTILQLSASKISKLLNEKVYDGLKRKEQLEWNSR